MYKYNGRIGTAIFVGRAGSGPKFRKGYGCRLGYGFAVMDMGRSRS